MSKTNEIKCELFKQVCSCMKSVTDTILNCHVIEPAYFDKELTYLISKPDSYIKNLKVPNKKNPDYVNKNNKKNAILLSKLNKIYNIKDLMIEVHFLHQFFNDNDFNPVLHKLFKTNDFIEIEDQGEVYVDDYISKNIASHLESKNFDYYSLGNLFKEIEKDEYRVENTIFNNKLAGKINPLSNKKVLKNR
ncbi:MAG: hypothetical protein E7184_04015 [Erysipelotrichaceae bacterium]|nr:hypothetical protein [Erysipelotrichaceae bacterium]